tara:strand:+ start:308 stop:640 length:333 start_codon:yes stop_codon:yes gene_type:complete
MNNNFFQMRQNLQNSIPKNLTGYVGVPAPRVLSDDDWFGPAVISDSNKDYMVREAEIKKEEEKNHQYSNNEPENIHEIMYNIATKICATTLQIDPIGGSENFQSTLDNTL